MGHRNIIRVAWTQPQICEDCHHSAPEGWQELKYSNGGAYLEKRCAPCAEVHYGDALPELANDISKAKRAKSGTKTDDKQIAPPMLGMAG